MSHRVHIASCGHGRLVVWASYKSASGSHHAVILVFFIAKIAFNFLMR